MKCVKLQILSCGTPYSYSSCTVVPRNKNYEASTACQQKAAHKMPALEKKTFCLENSNTRKGVEGEKLRIC